MRRLFWVVIALCIFGLLCQGIYQQHKAIKFLFAQSRTTQLSVKDLQDQLFAGIERQEDTIAYLRTRINELEKTRKGPESITAKCTQKQLASLFGEYVSASVIASSEGTGVNPINAAIDQAIFDAIDLQDKAYGKPAVPVAR